jgi:hypothetical protein
MEIVACYRQYAANCLDLAQRVMDPKSRASLIAMAQVWITLAKQTERNGPSPVQHGDTGPQVIKHAS